MIDPARRTPFTDSAPAVDALVADLRAVVLQRMTPAGLVPDRVTVFVLDELLADALVSTDLALLRQAELEASGELPDPAELDASAVTA